MKIVFIIILIIGFLFGASRMFEKGDVVLKVGDVAPDFTLLSQNKKKVTIKDYSGKCVVVYSFLIADAAG
jgi:peroxiredoxin